eukprot:TRINITY_DN10498_c0_g3_i3.p1 TRINITY_DN10498_c0_g3~~TRINITY_DN10498_c0_g3_i3.p1  ORF type:complete len:112 (-),score=14.32 TRINITY_DN10498_c0_g3_i3:1052-1387(-)
MPKVGTSMFLMWDLCTAANPILKSFPCPLSRRRMLAGHSTLQQGGHSVTKDMVKGFHCQDKVDDSGQWIIDRLGAQLPDIMELIQHIFLLRYKYTSMLWPFQSPQFFYSNS